MKRILVCEFHQETNTFNPLTMAVGRFIIDKRYEGQDAYDRLKKRPVVAHGMFDAIEERGAEVIPTIFLHASSGGRVEDAALELMLDRMRYYIENAGDFDAICTVLHGATCTVSEDDACGVFLRELRNMVGNKPIAAGFDLHANITEQVFRYADIICGYQTYPHIDHYQTGYRAGKLCMELLDGKTITKALTSIPMLIPPSGYSTTEGSFKDIIDMGKEMVEKGELLDFTIFPVNAWLDIKEISSTVVTEAANIETAKKCANQLAQKLYENRDEYMPEMMSVDEIIDLAEKSDTPKPVVLADAADSPNGGAVGDSPVVAMRLLERNSKLRTGMFVVDPSAVKKAFEVGVGKCSDFSIGAGFTLGMPGPFRAKGTVRSLHDGRFYAEGPANKGVAGTMGLAAVISFDNIDILVTEKCTHSGDPQVFRHFGIEPTMYDLIVVKANTSFKVPYGKFAGKICYADTPGACAANLRRFTWRRVPKGLYPIDRD